MWTSVRTPPPTRPSPLSSVECVTRGLGEGLESSAPRVPISSGVLSFSPSTSPPPPPPPHPPRRRDQNKQPKLLFVQLLRKKKTTTKKSLHVVTADLWSFPGTKSNRVNRDQSGTSDLKPYDPPGRLCVPRTKCHICTCLFFWGLFLSHSRHEHSLRETDAYYVVPVVM